MSATVLAIPIPTTKPPTRDGFVSWLAALLIALGLNTPAAAWVYPEHRDIAVLAVRTLDAERRAALDRLWADARGGFESRLCAQAADENQGAMPSCIDWSALPAIAGDHSCSPKNMMDIVLESDWILRVADVAARLKAELAKVPVVPPPTAAGGIRGVADLRRRVQTEALRAQRINALRDADLRLQRADPEYATRAGANNAHFLLARPSPDVDEAAYGRLIASPGADLNALGVYVQFHLSALQKASRLAVERLRRDERRMLARAALADEAFALHFLQDAFAAGHVAGTWGDSSQRKGTHDYYNENGLEVFTWNHRGTTQVLMGDAHMRPEDARVAAEAVRKSLEQLVDAAEGRLGDRLPHTPAAPLAPDAFDVCRESVFAARPDALRMAPETRPLFTDVLASTPVPGLGAGLGAIPRFRSELGAFFGLAAGIDARRTDGGFVAGQTGSGVIGGLDLSFRAGVGLDGVVGESGDGLIFFAVGLRADTASSNKFSDSAAGANTGSITAAVPARTGLSLRGRMPFYLVPGDLVLLSPLYLVAPERYTAMAVAASNGGLIPWQSGFATRFGRFQFVLGREVGLTLFGRGNADQLLAEGAGPGAATRLITFRSKAWDFPILEFRPYRSFSGNQASTLLFQLFAGLDVPASRGVASPPGAPDVRLGTVRSIGLRMVFDWRYYQ